MGRQKRKKKQRSGGGSRQSAHSAVGGGGGSAAAGLLPQSVSSSIQKGLAALTSDVAKERATACATIAHLFAASEHNTSLDAASLQQLYAVRVKWCVQSGSLQKLAKLVADPARKVRLHATGALRNIAIEGGPLICGPLVDAGAVEALLGSVSDMRAGMAVSEQRDVSLYVEIIEEQLQLLAELFRHEARSVAAALRLPRTHALLHECLLPDQSSAGIMTVAMEVLHTLVENNTEMQRRVAASAPHMQQLAKIALSGTAAAPIPKYFKDDSNRADKFSISSKGQKTLDSLNDVEARSSSGGKGIAATAAAVASAAAAMESSEESSAAAEVRAPPKPRNFEKIEWFSLRLRACDILVEILEHTGNNARDIERFDTAMKEGLRLAQEALTSMDLRQEALLAAASPAASPQGPDDARAGAPFAPARNLQAAQRVLETLANWSTVDDDEQASKGRGADTGASERRIRWLADAKFLPLLLSKLQQIRGGASWTKLPAESLSFARTIRYRALCCVQNLSLNLPEGSLGSGEQLQQLWNHAIQLLKAASSEPGVAPAQSLVSGGASSSADSRPAPTTPLDEEERPDVAVAAMLAALLPRPELDDDFHISPDDVGVVVDVLGKSSSAEARASGASVVGAMCSFLEGKNELFRAGELLLRLCRDSSVLVAAEALNALYDGLSDESCVAVRNALKLPALLASLRPTLIARASNLGDSMLTDDQRERVEDVVSNLDPFIDHIRR